jgi:hypothetical protein
MHMKSPTQMVLVPWVKLMVETTVKGTILVAC